MKLLLGLVLFALAAPVSFAQADRIRAWSQDLDFLEIELLHRDKSFSSAARAEFHKRVGELRKSLPDRNDDEVLVGIAKAVALGRNAHTVARLFPSSLVNRFPLRVYSFSEGLYVVKALDKYKNIVGCRVVSIRERHLYVFDCAGKGVTRKIQAPPNALPRYTPLWWDLTPLASEQPWRHVLEAKKDNLPAYLRNPELHQWFEYFADSQTFYFNYNVSLNGHGETFAEFSERLMKFIEEHAIRKFTVDLRFNTGGNLDIARPFMSRIGGIQKLNERGTIFVTTGRSTFSAAIFHAGLLKRTTSAIFVGEPVADSLNFWAEGGDITLPNSRLQVRYSNGFHNYSGTPHPEFQANLCLKQDVRTLAPDVPVSPSWKDYLAGKDSALEAILSYRSR
jgi:hypothetical protein